MALLQILPKSNSLAFPHILLGHILLQEPKGKWHLGANTSNKLPRVWSNTKCIILYYYCTDETSEPGMTPECAQRARHTEYFLYSPSNMCIFEPIPKLRMPKQEPSHCPDEFPLPALGHTPCDFLSWGCCVCSAVCKHRAPDSLEGYWSLGIVFIPISPGLEHFTRGKWSPWTVWAVRLQPVTTLQWLHARLRPGTQTGQEHLMSFKFSSFWFGGNWLLRAHPQLGKMSQHS